MTKAQRWVFLVILALGIVAVCLSISERTVYLNVTVKNGMTTDPYNHKTSQDTFDLKIF